MCRRWRELISRILKVWLFVFVFLVPVNLIIMGKRERIRRRRIDKNEKKSRAFKSGFSKSKSIPVAEVQRQNGVVLKRKEAIEKVPKVAELVQRLQKASNVLIVGDGDFSFSLSVMRWRQRMQKSSLKKNECDRTLCVSSYDSEKLVLEKYENAARNIEMLKKGGAVVKHNIDATRLETCMRGL